MLLFAGIEASPTIWVEVMLLAAIAAAVAYAVYRFWPKAFYPHVFAILLPIIVVAGVAIFWSPAVAFALVLLILFITGAASTLS
jgi:thiosulfate reductase cytochrome b subunit